jgi:endothelin-converting enzyme/putative endopeptidase
MPVNIARILRWSLVCATIALTMPLLHAQTPAAIQTIPGFDKTVMDTTADPCVDFYQYACGNYSKLHPIPADLPVFDQFANLYEFNLQALHGLLEKASTAHVATGSDEQKIGDYYASCMDTAAIDKAGLAPIQPELDRIAAIQSLNDLTRVSARLQLLNVNPFLAFGSQPDFKDATREIAAFDQGGLGLPEKDYYLRTGAKDDELRKQYVQHIANVLKLLGESPDKAGKDAADIMAFETGLARVSMGNVERRDPDNIYHMQAVAKLAADTPNLHIVEFLRDTGAPPVTELNVANPHFFAGLNTLIASTSLDTLKNYMRVLVVDSVSSQLPKAFDDENFDFYGRELEGIPEQQARWKRCVNATDSGLGEVLGKVYVGQYFGADSKARTAEEVKQIEAAMGRDLDEIQWMSPATKAKAREKLADIIDKVGYPNKWRDYSALTIKPGDSFGNLVRAREFENAYQLHKIGRLVDKREWEMTPPTVNAYYSPSTNTINFPAGILLPVFYDKTASDATNFGHIGSFVGHELTHGFDDQGRRFDGQGNLKDWWTAEDTKRFEDRTACVVNEYNGFVAVDDLHVNGKLTLGENTADNGGLRLAWMALVADAAGSHTPLDRKTATGYTPKQELFLGWAQNWCASERPEFLRMSAQVDVHSPDRIRANGVVVNFPEFSEAFGCKKGQPMSPAPEKMCRVW